jgi:peptidoglycan/LPS O-acetylase OafA/YrhL
VSLQIRPARLRHVPALDGLRGLALLGVLLFHANGALAGGYLGVDLFFVLSGFLITSLLLAEHREAGRIALGVFWIRRARRLFPALLSLMPVVALYGRYFARREELQAVRAQALAALAYVANWQAIFRHQSYWQLFAAPSPLEHTWSLSIEEQFYVVWPILVSLVLRRRGARTLLIVCLALSALSMAATLFLFDPGNTTRAYLGTDTRMAGILFGAALATVLSPDARFASRTVRALDALGVVALLGLGVAWASLRGTNPFLYHGGFWLTELGALCLIACAVAGERSLVARALAIRPLTWLGTISYGVYLWHWPVNVFLSTERTHLHGFGLHALRFALTFAIALVSYRFLEQPIRKHGVPFNRPLYIVPAAVALSVLLIVHATYAEARVEPPAPSAQLPSAAAAPEFVRFRIAVFGDSTANSLGWSLRNLHGEGVAIELLGKDGCNMLEDTCDGAQWVEQVRSLHPNATIVYLAGVFLYGFHVHGDWHTACRPDWDARLGRVLALRLAELAHEGGVVFTATVPYPVGPYENDSSDRREFHQRVDCINAVIRKSAAKIPGVRVLGVAERLCAGGVCQQDVGESEPIRPDGVHFSIDASKGLAHWVYEELRH